MKIGIIQQHNTADLENNKRRLAEGIEELARQGAQLIVLQELHNGLYFCQVERKNNKNNKKHIIFKIIHIFKINIILIQYSLF